MKRTTQTEVSCSVCQAFYSGELVECNDVSGKLTSSILMEVDHGVLLKFCYAETLKFASEVFQSIQSWTYWVVHHQKSLRMPQRMLFLDGFIFTLISWRSVTFAWIAVTIVHAKLTMTYAWRSDMRKRQNCWRKLESPACLPSALGAMINATT